MSTNLAVAFISNSSDHQILTCSSADGTHWPANTKVNQASQAAPSLAIFQGKYWMAFLSNNTKNEVLICSSDDGVSWSDNIKVGQTSKAAPSLVAFNGKLFVAFLANDSTDRILICSSSDGASWSGNTKVGQSSKAAPCLCVFNGKLFVAFIANDSSDRILICSSSDGASFSGNTQVGQASALAPSLCVCNGKLFLAFIANNSKKDVLVCSSSDGASWSGNSKVGQTSPCTPSLAAINNTLWLGFISNNDSTDILVCSSGDGASWSGNTKIGQTSKFAPVLLGRVLTSGQARPSYQVLTVVYAPPGTNGGKGTSSVNYANTSATGTTTSVSKSFKAGLDVSVTFGDKTNNAGGSFGYSRTTTDISTVDVKKSDTYSVTVYGPNADGIDHDHDLFYLCLNPLLTVTADNWNNVTWDVGVDGSTMIIQYVYAGWLKDPSKMPANVKAVLDNHGLTTDDYAHILAQNPFSGGSTTIDTSRYMSTGQSFPYIPPYNTADPVPLQTYNHQNTITLSDSHAVQSQYTVSVTLSQGFPDVWSAKETGTLQWTNTNTYGTSSTSTQSATVTVGGPSAGYIDASDVTDVLVYWDTLYNSFMFAFPATAPVSTGAITNQSGQPVANAPVTLTVGARTLKTYTDAQGNYRFYNAPAGQGTVAVSGTSHAVSVGPKAQKASLKIA